MVSVEGSGPSQQVVLSPPCFQADLVGAGSANVSSFCNQFYRPLFFCIPFVDPQTWATVVFLVPGIILFLYAFPPILRCASGSISSRKVKELQPNSYSFLFWLRHLASVNSTIFNSHVSSLFHSLANLLTALECCLWAKGFSAGVGSRMARSIKSSSVFI